MTYNEWRDELKSNLLSVSEAERKRVLDYYAEAYADRREAGYSEREIINQFGAPYDAAQRILNENIDDGQPSSGSTANSGGVRFTGSYSSNPEGDPFTGSSSSSSGGVKFTGSYSSNPDVDPFTGSSNPNSGGSSGGGSHSYGSGGGSSAGSSPQPQAKGWLFIVLCIVFCVPLFGLIMGVIGIIIGLCATPFGLMAWGISSLAGAVALMIAGDFAYAFYILGNGLIVLGIGIILIPLIIKLVKFIWKVFKRIIAEIKNLFFREHTV